MTLAVSTGGLVLTPLEVLVSSSGATVNWNVNFLRNRVVIIHFKPSTVGSTMAITLGGATVCDIGGGTTQGGVVGMLIASYDPTTDQVVTSYCYSANGSPALGGFQVARATNFSASVSGGTIGITAWALNDS